MYLFSLTVGHYAYAICPICVIAVGAGVGVSRWLGIDDIITGLWIGGLAVSMIIWTINWLEKKNIKFKFRNIITAVGYYAIIVIPLYFNGIIGNPLNILCGYNFLDKMLLGIINGSIAFYFAVIWYEYLKEKNEGRAYFPFQKVAMPVLFLVIISIIFYYLTK